MNWGGSERKLWSPMRGTAALAIPQGPSQGTLLCRQYSSVAVSATHTT
jgi:hypothetical protein